jgi:stage II sporulation protein D
VNGARVLAVLLAAACAGRAGAQGAGASIDPAQAGMARAGGATPVAGADAAAAPRGTGPAGSRSDGSPIPGAPAAVTEPLPELPPLAPPPAADLSDPMELLWGHRLEFAPGGEPLVTIRLMEGQREIAFRPLGRARIMLRNGGEIEVAAGARLTVRARAAVPAVLSWHPLLAEAPIAARARLEGERVRHEALGLRTETRTVGGVYGLAGRVVDNRRTLLLAASDGSEEGARAAAEALRRAHGIRPALHGEVLARPSGRLELSGEAGAPLGTAEAAVTVLVEGDAGFVVEGVEHERGPAARAREDRTYRGRLYVTLDASGALAAVHGVPLEELLSGLVPSEMPGSSPAQALKAQAVTARSNVLAQIGTRHLTDPFMLCAEVHCQSYRGDGARTARTDEAVRATRGEAIFGQADRTLVDAVYSAMCGGHGEDADRVWGGTPSPSLRGRPDLPPGEAARWTGGLASEPRLRAFLAAPTAAYCRRPGKASRDRFRWERRLTQRALDGLAAPLGVGRVRALEIPSRGASGRALTLRVIGDAGRAEVVGELRIRRLLGDLPSAMFVVERRRGAWVLRGGGWGHGAGMCQWGAVGRAAAGQGYQEILRAYYSGAEVVRIY